MFWFKAYVSQEILNWHSLRHSHSAEICIHFGFGLKWKTYFWSFTGFIHLRCRHFKGEGSKIGQTCQDSIELFYFLKKWPFYNIFQVWYSLEIWETLQGNKNGDFINNLTPLCSTATLVIQLLYFYSRSCWKEPFICALQSHHGRHDQSDQRCDR